jgi:signal peptidase I
MKQKNILRKFWDFLKEDSWPSLLVFLIISIIFIKFIFFPALSFITGTPLPLVIVESCSMYHHEKGFEKIFDESKIYEDYEINLDNTKNWDFQEGLNKGDVIFVIGPNNLKKGDVIIFEGGESHPIIHRLIKDKEPYSTKGDNYKTNPYQLTNEKEISEDQLIGKAVFRIPYLGWIKLIFFEHQRNPNERGFCK